MATKVYAGATAIALTLPFEIWVYVGCRKFDLSVTKGELVAKHWLRRFRLKLSEVASVGVRDRLELPEPCRGHIKVGLGYSAWKDLKVLVCRRGAPGVEIRRKDGTLLLIVPRDAAALCEAIRKGAQEATATGGETS